MLDCQFLLPFSDLMDARSTAGKRVSSTLTSTLAETDSLVLGQGRAGLGRAAAEISEVRPRALERTTDVIQTCLLFTSNNSYLLRMCRTPHILLTLCVCLTTRRLTALQRRYQEQLTSFHRWGNGDSKGYSSFPRLTQCAGKLAFKNKQRSLKRKQKEKDENLKLLELEREEKLYLQMT